MEQGPLRREEGRRTTDNQEMVGGRVEGVRKRHPKEGALGMEIHIGQKPSQKEGGKTLLFEKDRIEKTNIKN